VPNKSLLNKLRVLGLPLFEAEKPLDVNSVLADVVKSRNLRFWEGFPVLLANSAREGMFDYEQVKFSLKKLSDKTVLVSLVLASFALYKIMNLKFSWADKLSRSFPLKGKVVLKDYVKKLKSGRDLPVAGRNISSSRLKTVFNNYFKQAEAEFTGLLSLKDEFSFERALSCLFSPKQKELFLKKVKREKLTKTEREYYSRVVKKKVLALANLSLHRLARKLLEE